MAKTLAKRRRRGLSSAWDKLLRLIPGFDPFRLEEGHYFDRAEAERAIAFFPACLSHIRGRRARQPFELEPWQRAILGNLFGWRRIEDGLRRFREAFIFVPRKNGKTVFTAGIALYLLFCDGEPGAEIYAAAADTDQAAILFSTAKEMVLREPVLQEAAEPYQRSIHVPSSSSFMKVISADARTKHGFNAHAAIIDELHAQPDAELVDVLDTSMGSRLQPLLIFLSTADLERPGSICNEKQDYAEKVRDGIIDDPHLLPVIYKAAPEDDWTAPETWRRANPNLGISVSVEYFQRHCKRAQELPRYENTFKRLFLNIRTGQATRWLPMDIWRRSSGEELLAPAEGEFTREAFLEYLRGRPCYAGLDLSSTRDITALVLAFPLEGGAIAAAAWFWVPEEQAEARERRDKVPYITWARQGWIELTPGNVTDFDRVLARIGELRERYQIREMAIDRWQGEYLGQKLEAEGLDVYAHGQGYASMSFPAKELEKVLLGGKLYHGGNPVLTWMASNVATEEDAAGNIKPSKKRSGEKIDGIVALVMALGRARQGKVKKESVYKRRGLLRL